MTNQQTNDIYKQAINDAKGVLSRFDKKIQKNAKTLEVPKGATFDWLNNSSFNSVVYPRDKIPDRLLKMVE